MWLNTLMAAQNSTMTPIPAIMPPLVLSNRFWAYVTTCVITAS